MKSHREKGLRIYWRGELSGCNYDCSYCPFAKRTDDRETLKRDRLALERFANWVETRDYPIEILITPWGEGLVRKYYQQIMTRLSHCDNVKTIAIQTNLSCSIDWISACNKNSFALWVTYHPGQTSRIKFLEKVDNLSRSKVRHSIGIVACREHFQAIERLRADLPEESYLWINAEESLQGKYTPEEIKFLTSIDPLFPFSNTKHESLDQLCSAGERSISIDAFGNACRCHFLKTPIGNIYDDSFENNLFPRTCSKNFCDCHIGYSNLESLNFDELYGQQFMERRFR